jgi:hypothetical protein
MSDKSTEALMPKQPIPRATSTAVDGIFHTGGPGACQTYTSLDEERREIVASVLGALAGNAPDPDEMAACSYLLKHLSQTAGRPAA